MEASQLSRSGAVNIPWDIVRCWPLHYRLAWLLDKTLHLLKHFHPFETQLSWYVLLQPGITLDQHEAVLLWCGWLRRLCRGHRLHDRTKVVMVKEAVELSEVDVGHALVSAND